MEVTPTSANVMEYVRIVRDKALHARRWPQAAGGHHRHGAGGRRRAAGDVLEAAEQKIYAIRRGRSAQGMVPISVVLQDVHGAGWPS